MSLSRRDPGQVLQAAFDDDTQSLKTTVVNIVENAEGVTEVSINDADDSIKIGNGSGQYAAVNSDGSLNVNVVSTGPGTSYNNIIQYDEIVNVAMGATETVLSFTVPNTGTFYLTRINFSGDCISEFDLQINGSVNAKQRLYYTKFNSIFDYTSSSIPGYNLIGGTIINVIVTNYSLQGVGSFNATLEGITTT